MNVSRSRATAQGSTSLHAAANAAVTRRLKYGPIQPMEEPSFVERWLRRG